jgi:glutathione S-transferase
VSPKTAPYGSWKSPVTSDLIAAQSISLSEPRLDGEQVYWLHALPGPESYEQIPALAERGRVRIQHFFAWLDVRLSDNEYVCGPHFTVADITGMVTVDFCSWAKLKAPEHFGHLRRWHAAVSARQSAKA